MATHANAVACGPLACNPTGNTREFNFAGFFRPWGTAASQQRSGHRVVRIQSPLGGAGGAGDRSSGGALTTLFVGPALATRFLWTRGVPVGQIRFGELAAGAARLLGEFSGGRSSAAPVFRAADRSIRDL